MLTLQKFPITLETDFTKINSIHTLLIEISDADIMHKCEKFGISLSENTLQKMKKFQKEEKFFTVYPENDEIFQVVFFFSQKDNRLEICSEMCKKFSKNHLVFIPDGNEIEALEIMTLATYQYTEYKTKKDVFEKIFFVEDVSKLSIIEQKIPLLEAIIVARNIVNMPPNDLNPESFSECIRAKKWKHFDVEIFGDAELRSLGCNLIRAVGQGSVRESFMVILKPKYEIPGEKYGFIGKGVTFDAGGIQIKPDKYMIDMKCDMAGAAGMLGVALYLDSLDVLPVHAIFGFGIVENMTGDAAFKPLDIYTAYNGKTVEIHHTDAEWRLVLADVMAYVEKTFSPEHLITMATLTGACIYALGNDISGIMGDDEVLIEKFLNNDTPYESVWRLPLTPKMIQAAEGEISDVKNLSESEKAGSSMGAAFLSHFQGNAKLTHLDIAGPAYRSKSLGYMNEGGTGWWVKKISEIILSL